MEHAITIGDVAIVVGIVLAVMIPLGIILAILSAYGRGMSR